MLEIKKIKLKLTYSHHSCDKQVHNVVFLQAHSNTMYRRLHRRKSILHYPHMFPKIEKHYYDIFGLETLFHISCVIKQKMCFSRHVS